MINLKRVLLPILMVNLTGCVAPKENFDCKYGKGVGCHSITEVNELVNQGKLSKEPTHKPLTSTIVSSPVAINSNFSANGMSVQRVTEEHLTLWIAPFQDKQGNFHEGAIVHTVLKPGFWQVEEGV